MSNRSLSAAERETVVTSTDDGETVTIWTTQRRHLGRLRRNPSFTEVRNGSYGSTEWAEFTIPADRWNPASGAKRAARHLTDEQRAAAGQRLAEARCKGEAE